jgi:peptide/nickel transport system permease protein
LKVEASPTFNLRLERSNVSPLISNLITLAIVVGFGWMFWRARKLPLWQEAFRRLRRNRLALAALAVVAVYVTIGLLDSVSWKDNRNAAPRSIVDRVFERPKERTYSAPFARFTTGEPQPHPVRERHLLGTDAVGNDVLYLTLKGCRTALIIAGLTTMLATPVALLFGLLAGYFGKRVDDAVQYTYTTLDSIPAILLLIALLMVLGRGITQICIALGVTSWVGLCRLVRGETLRHREREYVRAARALGVSPLSIMFRHILPNLLPIVIISITLSLSGLILYEVVLTYLGLGLEPGAGSWGAMIDAARLELAREPVVWWNLVSAAVALFILVLALNLFGDALRDAIDPRLRGLEASTKNG